MNYRGLFVFLIMLFSIAIFACTPSALTLPYYYTSFNIRLEVGESLNLLSLPHETNLKPSDISLRTSSPILEINGLDILAVDKGDATLYVIETASQSVLSSIEVKVLSKNTNDITYSVEHTASSEEDNYILSLFYLGENVIDFDFSVDSDSVSVYKMASTLYISSPIGETFSITVVISTSFIVISFPIY